MKFKKTLAWIASISLLCSFKTEQKVKAIDPSSACMIVSTAIGIGANAVGFIYAIIKDGILIKHNYDEASKLKQEIEKYKGFKSRQEVTALIKDVVNGVSPIRIYGQDRAKRQCAAALSGCLGNIYGDFSEIRGNVVYMIGPSGVGKTTMAKALANAFLKHPEKTCLFIDSNSVNNEQPLGEQLFKTTTKSVNLKKDKNFKNLWGTLDIKDNEEGSYDIRVATRILQHIFNYCESVVIIDEYDKMKLACRPAEAPEDYEDRTADEIIKSISDRGEYDVGNNKVDCRKTLFFITSNESKEDLYSKFGYRGAKGGGVQRINVIEFDKLDFNCCKKIIDDMVKRVKKNLLNHNGDFKIDNVVFSPETLEHMANYIYNDTDKQARAKFDLEQNIYALFNFELDENVNKSFEVIYTPSETEGEIGNFNKRELKVQNTPVNTGIRNLGAIKDYAAATSIFKIKDYSKKQGLCSIRDYSKKN